MCPGSQSEGWIVSWQPIRLALPWLDKGQLIICIQTRSDSGYLELDMRGLAPISGVKDTSSLLRWIGIYKWQNKNI